MFLIVLTKLLAKQAQGERVHLGPLFENAAHNSREIMTTWSHHIYNEEA